MFVPHFHVLSDRKTQEGQVSPFYFCLCCVVLCYCGSLCTLLCYEAGGGGVAVPCCVTLHEVFSTPTMVHGLVNTAALKTKQTWLTKAYVLSQ